MLVNWAVRTFTRPGGNDNNLQKKNIIILRFKIREVFGFLENKLKSIPQTNPQKSSW